MKKKRNRITTAKRISSHNWELRKNTDIVYPSKTDQRFAEHCAKNKHILDAKEKIVIS